MHTLRKAFKSEPTTRYTTMNFTYKQRKYWDKCRPLPLSSPDRDFRKEQEEWNVFLDEYKKALIPTYLALKKKALKAKTLSK